MDKLLSVGPATMAEDENRIVQGYQLWLTPFFMAIPLLTAYFFDVKWVLAASFAALLTESHQSNGRLHDLCIRLRRTNLLIMTKNSE